MVDVVVAAVVAVVAVMAVVAVVAVVAVGGGRWWGSSTGKQLSPQQRKMMRKGQE